MKNSLNERAQNFLLGASGQIFSYSSSSAINLGLKVCLVFSDMANFGHMLLYLGRARGDISGNLIKGYDTGLN